MLRKLAKAMDGGCSGYIENSNVEMIIADSFHRGSLKCVGFCGCRLGTLTDGEPYSYSRFMTSPASAVNSVNKWKKSLNLHSDSLYLDGHSAPANYTINWVSPCTCNHLSKPCHFGINNKQIHYDFQIHALYQINSNQIFGENKIFSFLFCAISSPLTTVFINSSNFLWFFTIFIQLIIYYRLQHREINDEL